MYAGLMPSEMRRLKQLEEENGKLKRLVADLSLWTYAGPVNTVIASGGNIKFPQLPAA